MFKINDVVPLRLDEYQYEANVVYVDEIKRIVVLCYTDFGGQVQHYGADFGEFKVAQSEVSN